MTTKSPKKSNKCHFVHFTREQTDCEIERRLGRRTGGEIVPNKFVLAALEIQSTGARAVAVDRFPAVSSTALTEITADTGRWRIAVQIHIREDDQEGVGPVHRDHVESRRAALDLGILDESVVRDLMEQDSSFGIEIVALMLLQSPQSLQGESQSWFDFADPKILNSGCIDYEHRQITNTREISTEFRGRGIDHNHNNSSDSQLTSFVRDEEARMHNHIT